MKVTRQDVEGAAADAGLGAGQAEAVWDSLVRRTARQQRFDAAHVAYYVGALIVIAAMGWLMNEAWESLGGLALAAIAAGYAVGFVLAGRTLWDRNDQPTVGGLLYTMAVCMTPLAVYGLERALGLWPEGDPGAYRGYHVWVKGSWILMEIGTIVAGVIALRFRRFPFLTAPVAFSLWYLSMDLTPLLFGQDDFTFDERKLVSLWFGLVMLLAAYWADLRNPAAEDFAFWGYLFGLLAFWGGLSMMESDSELSKLVYCAINVGLIALSVLLRQKAFIVFGSLGVMGYLGHLAYRVFQDSLLFPFVLTLVGLSVIYLGVVYQKNQAVLEARLRILLPGRALELLPPRVRAREAVVGRGPR